MSFLAQEQMDKLEELKELKKYDEAISYVNGFLVSDPHNDELLLHIADIQYKKGEIDKAAKAIDFLNITTDHTDPMGLYVKGVLEMEKNNWKDARSYLLKAMDLTEKNNHEISRCYGLCEYWYGNREKWLHILERAHDLRPMDAEILYNLIELYLLERRFKKAKECIAFFHEHHKDLDMYEKKIAFYKNKIKLFSAYADLYSKNPNKWKITK